MSDRMLANETIRQDKPLPKGCTRRTLSMRDRQVVLAACARYAGGEKREAEAKVLRKLARVQELLRAEEVEDYYAALEHHYRLEIEAWRRAQEESIRAGRRDVVKAPKPAKDELEGPTEAFDLPSHLDAWIKEALGAATFPIEHAQAVSKVMELYQDEEA